MAMAIFLRPISNPRDDAFRSIQRAPHSLRKVQPVDLRQQDAEPACTQLDARPLPVGEALLCDTGHPELEAAMLLLREHRSSPVLFLQESRRRPREGSYSSS